MECKVKLEVSAEAKGDATKCKCGCACLENDGEELCEVIDSINGTVHFIKRRDEQCAYCFAYADDFVCFCPVRKEIFNKYGI